MPHIDAKYRRWIQGRPCCQCGKRAPSEAHHRTGAGMALKAADADAMPLCHRCHMDFHDLKGWARNMSKAERRAWQDEQVQFHQRLYKQLQGF